MPHINKKQKEPYTEILTIDEKTLQIEVFTGEKSSTKTVTFTSKLSLTNYLDRLRKNLSKQVDEETGQTIHPQTDIPLCIIDTIRDITTRFNLTKQSQEVTQELSHQLKRGDKLRFRPPTMLKVEKSNKEIRKERMMEILEDIKFGDLEQAKHKMDKYFGK